MWAMQPPTSMCVSGQELTLEDGRTVVHTVLEGPPEACQHSSMELGLARQHLPYDSTKQSLSQLTEAEAFNRRVVTAYAAAG